MQRLWLLSCDWDDDLPLNIQEDWCRYKTQLPSLESLSIPRWTEYRFDSDTIELHGFADASEKAYAAVVYIRIRDPSGLTKISLLTAKSRVAPIKLLSIPRLELCAALLLSELMIYTREALQIVSIPCHCWSDSIVTLAWLNQPSSKWKPFVAHRVAKIQDLTDKFTWHHVPTSDNPADCASRGLLPNEILNHSLWWSGPTWLMQSPSHWPQSVNVDIVNTNLEKRSTVISNNSTIKAPWSLQSRFSSWAKLIRVTAIILRFVHRLKKKQPPRIPRPLHIVLTQSLTLTSEELHKARIFWMQQIQAQLFPSELAALQAARTISNSSPLSALCPYLDSNNIMRVQGRLRFAPWLDENKHPIILGAHPLVRLLISCTHLQLLHAGPQLTLAHLRNTYWILRARQLIRSVLYQCVSCARAKANISDEFMGDLPSVRVTATNRAFIHTGVDYAGPILTRTAKGRGCKTTKSYIAVFVCMSTKAIHLELVTDYSSDAFIAAYKRFVSRRGLPSDLYSDNGTTFRGADRELSESYRIAVRDPNFANRLITEGTSWHFLPPAAPHFGGLWEAAVKSVKMHLKRCVGAHTLTYEELSTLLCCIEACLNSRPLTAASDCLDDYSALTPGHFLINGPLVAPPEPSVLSIQENRLTRWKVLQRLQEQFWIAWRREYLHTLQQRPKWRAQKNLTKVGQLVLLRDPGLPPSHWPLARIIQCHPGADGLVRVVTIKTQRSEYKRPITQLCFLPVDINIANRDSALTADADPADPTDHVSRM